MGTTLYEPEKAYDGYVLFAPVVALRPPLPSYALYLINMQGEVVHQWNLPFAPLQAQLLPNGHVIIDGLNDRKAPGRPGAAPYFIGGGTGWLVELTWEGKKVFEYEDLNMHHDFTRLPNGHLIYIAWERVSPQLRKRIRGGVSKSEFKDGTIFCDYLVEIDGHGKKVWQWHAKEHLNPDIDIIGPLYQRNEWLHSNGVDVLPNGNIVLTSRSMDGITVIDKKSGRIVSRWGHVTYLDPQSRQLQYRSGPNTLGGPHATYAIPAGLPGAGHLLCYDNGLYANTSRWVEVDPGTGRLVRQSAPDHIGRKHFSDFAGSAQRLPNGNTLLCDAANGRLMQVTMAGQKVWEYVSPFIPQNGTRGAIFKSRLYAKDYCPQFKSFPPAHATPVKLTGSIRVKEATPEWPKSIILLALGMLVFSFLGWQLGQRMGAARG